MLHAKHNSYAFRGSRLVMATCAALLAASGGMAQVKMSFPGSRPAMAPRGAPSTPALRGTTPAAPTNRPPGFQSGMRPVQRGPMPGRVSAPPTSTRPATTNVILPNGGLVFRPQGVVGGGAPFSGGVLEQPSGIVHGGYGHPLAGPGLTVNGVYTNDNWKVGFHLGSGYPAYVPNVGSEFCWPVPCNPCYPPVAVWPANPYWGFPWWGYSDYAYNGYRYDQIYGNYAPADPGLTSAGQMQPPVTETPQPSTQRELGDSYLLAGDAKAAIKSYRAFLKANPGDAISMRAIALALLEQGQPAEAAATMSMAYRTNPYLASLAVSPGIYKGGEDTFRKNLQRMSMYANRTQSASGWLSLAVMMQAEGRNDLARTMLDRARDAGLEPAVAEKMLSAIQG